MDEKDLLGEYKLTLGLEVHLHLNTKTGMFCGCSSDIYDAEPNTHTCPVCLGLPGALPVPNFEAIQKTQLLGLALHCTLNPDSRFDRKHYFYPDLPKGYQISQYKQPLCLGGYLDLKSGKRLEIERIHLEEDTAKSFHEGDKTLIDFNKSGMPLVEIVTTPSFTNTEDAVDFCKQVQDVVRYLKIGDVDMEKGQMRLEANISLRTAEMEAKNELAKYKVEVKNINSFRFMERAVKVEIKRQREILEKGGNVLQENRGWDEAHNTTVPQRSKEEAHDYRYFPEPDIPPMHFDQKYFDELKVKITELPWERKARLVKLGLSESASEVLSGGLMQDLFGKFEKLVSDGLDAVKVGNALVNKKELQSLSVDEIKASLASDSDKISDSGVLEEAVGKVISANQKSVDDYKKGKVVALEFLIGQVMRETKGKADSTTVRTLLIEKL
ncbi:MAG: hypothetical protein ACD_22C00028G0002 [uncultured bacterium]|nr:MAG: hypothetical protein ACD_22C00028G0002 [uncultured bacterium]